jgi:N utilization substance protein B
VSSISPSERRRARERAIEFLFGLGFTGQDWREALPHFWETFTTREASRLYADELIEGVEDMRTELDEAVNGALQGWTAERVGRIERVILRVALYEMRYRPDVPPKVAINEALELAKAYGAAESTGFINAVLDRLRDGSAPEPAPQT